MTQDESKKETREELPGKAAENAGWQDEYPRPQLQRGSFFSLDGAWLLDGRPVTVPWPPQAALSGWQGAVGEQLHYEKRFVLPAGFAGPEDRVILHFGAVDQTAAVFLNGRPAVRHEGGYLPFSADVTVLLRPGENCLTAEAEDTLSRRYPYGKQSKKPGGMWYTPVSGIWQSVWLEAVPACGAVTALRMTPDLSGLTLEVETDAPSYTVTVRLPGGGELCRVCTEKKVRLEPAQAGEPPRLWNPADPYLYRFTVETGADRVESYFALRTVSVETEDGRPRICLNRKPVFLHGVLDQGYFAGGVFLPAAPGEYERDVRRMQALGFNLLRKHIKLEPEAFYAACDRCGMLVLQDLVNSGGYNWALDTLLPNLGLQHRPDRWPGGAARKAFFRAHAAATQARLYNHPCVVGYTIFNEGWGQFDADAQYRACRAADPTRFYDATSGWFAQKESDVESLHVYFRSRPLRAKRRPLLLSECGGYARPVEGHLFRPDAGFGYGTAQTEQALTDRIERLYREMVLPSIPRGLCGSVYTQLSDVEEEVNGLYTMDRAVCKADEARLRRLAQALYREMARVTEHEEK